MTTQSDSKGMWSAEMLLSSLVGIRVGPPLLPGEANPTRDTVGNFQLGESGARKWQRALGCQQAPPLLCTYCVPLGPSHMLRGGAPLHGVLRRLGRQSIY